MTKNTRFVSSHSWEGIYGRYESSDRGTRSEFTNISLSRVWMSFPETSGSDDLDTPSRTQETVRYEISSLTPSVSLTSSLAVSLHTKTRE